MPSERRSRRRFETEIEATLERSSKGCRPEEPIVVVNLSFGGMSILANSRLEKGNRVRIALGSALEFEGFVTRVERCPDKKYLAAIKFTGGSKILKPPPIHKDPEQAVIRRVTWQFDHPSINPRAFTEHKRLARLKQYVDQSVSEVIPLTKAARIALMERTYFSAFFHEKVGITFSEWLQFVRVARAMDLMAMANFTVEEVSEVVGFGTVRTFERVFKKWTSLTPIEFKKLARPA